MSEPLIGGTGSKQALAAADEYLTLRSSEGTISTAERDRLAAIIDRHMTPQWRPIATAPKDGENEILLQSAEYRNCAYLGIWDEDADPPGFYCLNYQAEDELITEQLSHWMPLPEPPK